MSRPRRPELTKFAHLRVASGFSFRFGASQPEDLVAAAAADGQSILAITDRDGVYGSVRFAKACMAAGIKPVVGADLEIAGKPTDGRKPRAVVLATPGHWGQLCRVISRFHARGPIFPADMEEGLVVLLGQDSALGMALAAGDDARARLELQRWEASPARVVVAVACLLAPAGRPGCLDHAAKLLAFADAQRVPSVLVNDVRMASKSLSPICDVLDSARNLAPLARGLAAANAEGHLKTQEQMIQIAEQVSLAAGRPNPERLVSDTNALAEFCVLDPVADMGLGQTHLPEFSAIRAQAADERGELRNRCEAGLIRRYGKVNRETRERLEHELEVIAGFEFERYFLTVSDIVDMIRGRGIRVAARGSGAGSLVNYLLGISGVDPMAYGLVFERFLSPLRKKTPDIDIDVESARRLECYDLIWERFGTSRVACTAMVDTYRVRHAIRDAGKALSFPQAEIDLIAKSFPHIRARKARQALRELPELAALDERRLELLLRVAEGLDSLPRHLAMHPCGVLLSDTTLASRTPLQASPDGYSMSQFDKDDVEDLGFLKLDVLGVRMQSSLAHAVAEIERVDGQAPDIDALAPYDDPATYDLMARSDTIGCFQIESPGQRELLGKFGPENFNDIIVDISLFRPGPVKADMVVPFLDARLGWKAPVYPDPKLKPALEETCGVIVFHEQIIKAVAAATGWSYAEAEAMRRALGKSDPEQMERNRSKFVAASVKNGIPERTASKLWADLEAFASFGFCKAHAAAFALPTYQSAWLKRHHPAEFFAGVLTHDPGMYPKRLLVAQARLSGVGVLGADVNASEDTWRVEWGNPAETASSPVVFGQEVGTADEIEKKRAKAVRVPLTEVDGISESEVRRIIANRPYTSLTDFAKRARPSAPVLEGLVRIGAFDSLYPGRTRRDLLLAASELSLAARADRRTGEGQLAFDFDSGPGDIEPTGLPPFSLHEKIEAELDVLGFEVSAHVLSEKIPELRKRGVTFAGDLLGASEDPEKRRRVLVAGVKVATQTPPVRSGKRVVFLTLDDSTGLVDCTFFQDVQQKYATTVFGSWQLLVEGEIRRTGKRGISILAKRAWSLDEGASRKLWHASPGSSSW
ncbi:MAG: DNA polymerase III subunit alpha [Propionibacteriaceae bacterium]|nr:DNA polymerase III subunit alpha [Propionibacteriaceae bacterium]